MHSLNLPMIAAAAIICALPVFAQDAAPDEPLPPTTSEVLPPGGEAPVDEIPAISDVAPDGGVPDATAIEMACTFETECTDAECASSGYEGRLTVISDGAGLAEAEWDDPSETVALSATLDNDMILATSSGIEPGKQRLLTVAADGAARFTTHLTGPLLSITYLGACK